MISKMSDVSEPSEKEVGTKKPISKERLEQLAVARQKALDKKRLLKEISDKEKKMKEDALSQRLAKVREYETASKSIPEETSYRQKKPVSKKQPIIEESSSEDDVTDSSDEEPVKAPPRDRYVKLTSKKPVSRLTAEIAKDELRRRIEQENMNAAFSSLFPGYRFI